MYYIISYSRHIWFGVYYQKLE